jgi:hypothetical protein
VKPQNPDVDERPRHVSLSLGDAIATTPERVLLVVLGVALVLAILVTI